MLLASAVASLPFAANAADLYGDYSFIQDNVPSQPVVVGHLDLGAGYTWEEYDFGFGSPTPDQEYGFFGGAGRANIDLGSFNLELETGGSAAFDGKLDFYDNSLSSIGAAGHLWGATSNFAFGIFGAVNFPTSMTIYTLGGEAEAYLGAVTPRRRFRLQLG